MEVREAGCLSSPRGQVDTMIKTQFQRQPSGNSPHVNHEGQGDRKRPCPREITPRRACVHTLHNQAEASP